jgi:hypothetical protein
MKGPESGEQKAQPWHAADEKPARKKRTGGAPIGTHSLTGDPLTVGLPSSPKAVDEEAERSSPRDMPPGAKEPDPLAEPRASGGNLLGRKP